MSFELPRVDYRPIHSLNSKDLAGLFGILWRLVKRARLDPTTERGQRGSFSS